MGRVAEAGLEAPGAVFSFRDPGEGSPSEPFVSASLSGPIDEGGGPRSPALHFRSSATVEGAADMKLQLCMDFLDTGTCSRGRACRYAHNPSELSSRRSLHGGIL